MSQPLVAEYLPLVGKDSTVLVQESRHCLPHSAGFTSNNESLKFFVHSSAEHVEHITVVIAKKQLAYPYLALCLPCVPQLRKYLWHSQISTSSAACVVYFSANIYASAHAYMLAERSSHPQSVLGGGVWVQTLYQLSH